MDKSIPTRVEVKESQEVFVPDYKYVSSAEVKEITRGQLAKLEADLHSLRMVYVANGKNPNILIGQNRPIQVEMDKVTATIRELESYFSEVLSDENNAG